MRRAEDAAAPLPRATLAVLLVGHVYAASPPPGFPALVGVGVGVGATVAVGVGVGFGACGVEPPPPLQATTNKEATSKAERLIIDVMVT
jgi:hypothetical protein